MKKKDIPERSGSSIKGIMSRLFAISPERRERIRKAEDDHSHLRFLENLERVDRAIRKAEDLEMMMTDVLEEVLSIFGSNRAFLFYPCDPDAAEFSVPMERTSKEYPGAFARGGTLPILKEVADILRVLLASSGPVAYDPRSGRALPQQTASLFNIRSMLLTAIYPKLGSPWVFGMHQCSHTRDWTDEEVRLYQEIGRRVADSLNSLLLLRDLKESQEKFRQLSENVDEVFWITSPDSSEVVYCSPAYEKVFGLSREGLYKRLGSFIDLIHPEDRGRVLAALPGQALGAFDEEYRVVRPDGEVRWVRTHAFPVKDASGEVVRIAGITSDITGRKAAEEELVKSERKYRALFEESKDAIIIRGPNGSILDVNTSGVELFGYSSKEELMKVSFEELCQDRDEVRRFNEEIRGRGYVKDFEWRLVRKDGQVIIANATVNAVRDEKGEIMVYRGILRDVTERKKLEQQLLQAQKMEAIGQLSGGIAHDINNILSTITGAGELLLSNLREDDPARVFVENIMTSAIKGGKLTQNLLTFSRMQPIDLKPTKLNDLIANFQKFLSQLIGEDIELKTALTGDGPVVRADRSQIEQVLMNLAMNSRLAMPGGGVLTITTELAAIDDKFVGLYGYGKPGRYAMVRISDTGVGIPRETMKRIFEPFFTTREVGKGSGLGLSIVYGIIKQHNDYINVYSEPGEGTEFRIYLPLTEQAVEEIGPEVQEHPARGSEKVLLAEDDSSIRGLLRLTLEKYGYIVVEAADGDEAIRKFGENKGIRLLITDVVMPRKNGFEVYRELLKTDPLLKAVFMSGYAEGHIREKGVRGGEFEFISKPLLPTDLLRKVRTVLDREKKLRNSI